MFSSNDTCLFPLPLCEQALVIRYAPPPLLIESVNVYDDGVSQLTAYAGKQLSNLLSN